MKIRFKATLHHKTHRLPDGTVFYEGDVVDLPKEEAERLLREFPKNFESLEQVKEQMKEAKNSQTKEAKGGKTKEAK